MARWARSEAGVLSASARAAAATTREVTRSVLESRKDSASQRALDGLLQELAARLAARGEKDATPIADDQSFWELIDQLQRWRVQAGEPAAVAPSSDVEAPADEERAAATEDADEPVTDAVVAEESEPEEAGERDSKK